MSHHYSGPNVGFPHGDARLDFTDLYAFPKPGDSSKSILIMDVHPSVGVNPPGPATSEPFAPEARYEIQIDTDGDAVADITYQVRFASSQSGAQTATLRRIEGAQAAATGAGGHMILDGAPVSTGREARVTQAGAYRFFVGWRSDPFFFEVQGAVNNLHFTGTDFFADRDICGIVLELPNSLLGAKEVGIWARTLIPVNGDGGNWVQADRGAGPSQTPFSPTSKTKPTSPESRPRMPVLSPSSRTPWSILVDIRPRTRSAWQGPCCRTSCTITPRNPRPSRTMAVHSATMFPMPSWVS